VGALFVVFPCSALADINYYNNVIVGDRAMGLGGAFTGISDDASALVYNPAGLGFLLNSSVSGSANAYMIRDIEYKKTIGNKSFEERSNGFFPPFAGGAKKVDSLLNGLGLAFAIYSPDSEFKDQDDYIRDTSLGIESFHRTENKRASTLHIALGGGWRTLPWLSVGLGTSFFLVDEVRQSYQDAVLRQRSVEALLSEAAQKKGPVYATQTQNVRTKLAATGVEPVFGVQGVFFDRLSLGVAFRKAFFVSQSFEYKGDTTRYSQFANGAVVQGSDLKEGTCTGTSAESSLCKGQVRHATPGREYSKEGALALKTSQPFTTAPSELRLGAAWFATTSLLLAADVSHHFAAEGRKDLELDRGAVTNYHAGLEWYVVPALPVRLGAFTNFDTRPKVQKGKAESQPDHINYYGGSFALAWSQSGGQIGGGAAVQYGQGQAQKIAGSDEIQEVSALSTTLFFSATHNL
jgi:long-chain fatty acid transport protein